MGLQEVEEEENRQKPGERRLEAGAGAADPCSLVPHFLNPSSCSLLLLDPKHSLGSESNRQIQSLPHCVIILRCGYSGGTSGGGKQWGKENPNEREQQFGRKSSVSHCVISQSPQHTLERLIQRCSKLFPSVQNNNKEREEVERKRE